MRLGAVSRFLALVLCLTRPVGAQRVAPVGAVRPTEAAAADAGTGVQRAVARELGIARRRGAPWWAPVASAIVPGAGQAAMGQDRWIAFAAFEGAALLRYSADRQEGLRERRTYRRLANQVARALYTTGSPPSGAFEYYEAMERWVESGVYDAEPGGELEPESDLTTFNGSIWLLARQTYWTRPDSTPDAGSDAYRQALEFYDRRAVRPAYRWSWRNAQLEQDLYRRAIDRSNAAFRRSAEDLAAVLANHVLSTVDAYVTVRLRRRTGAVGEVRELSVTLPWR